LGRFGLAHVFTAAPELRAHLDERDPVLADYMSAAMAATPTRACAEVATCVRTLSGWR
jgi:hypothetical protein